MILSKFMHLLKQGWDIFQICKSSSAFKYRSIRLWAIVVIGINFFIHFHKINVASPTKCVLVRKLFSLFKISNKYHVGGGHDPLKNNFYIFERPYHVFLSLSFNGNLFSTNTASGIWMTLILISNTGRD